MIQINRFCIRFFN